MFNAILLNKPPSGFEVKLTELDDAALIANTGDADVTVRVEYSTINYKDGLAITDTSPVVRRWPMVPGIDGAGTVEASAHPDYRPGDKIVINGFGVGETHWGCLAQKARLKASWLVPLPGGMTTRAAMAIGTAGYTAMLSVLALEKHGIEPTDGEILVTGASGGVGSVAIAILKGRGYKVVASTGRLDEAPYLRSLGAAEVIDRKALSSPGKPLQKERFAGVIDAVGSHTLANACAQTRYRGVVTACGLAQGMDFPASVAPFILRGVTLVGIDSVMAPQAERRHAWGRLAAELDPAKLDAITRSIGLADVQAAAADILAGKVRGRLLVDVNG